MDVTKKKILVVDDDDDIRSVISLILREEGYAVSELNNGQAVVKTIQQARPDVLLLDVMLGDMDGRDICKELKQLPETEDIPIIIISATHGWHTRHEKNCRADDYISKPFDIDELVSHVRQYAA